MNQYNYPIKYISGLGVQIFEPELLERKINNFDLITKMTSPILGETGIDGLLIDFNYGLRLQVPEGNWHVRIIDHELDFEFIDDDLSAVTLISIEKFWIDWEITVWRDGEPVFYHQFDPTEQKVHFNMTGPTLGDNIALLPYVEAFRQQYHCEVTCSIAEYLHPIVRNYYPSLRLTKTLPEDSYACFHMQAAFGLPMAASTDAGRIPILTMGQAILRRVNLPPKVIFTPTKPRAIQEPYVCIGVQASQPVKGWLNPDGWSTVVEYLHSIGYRVVCIDRYQKSADEYNEITMPKGVEDFTGNHSLLDRINTLAYADFFIGLSSGLSWLAWAVDIPVIMISGITERWYEFDNPYRVDNPFVCHGCFNWSHNSKLLKHCMKFGTSERAYECSKMIMASQVILTLERLIVERGLAVRNLEGGTL